LGCSAYHPAPKVEGLTVAEKAALLKDVPGIEKYLDLTKHRPGPASERFGYEPLEVLDAPDPSYKIKREKCVSGIIMSPFSSSTITLEELVRYLRAQGVRVNELSFPGKSVNLGQVLNLRFPRGATLCEVASAANAQTDAYLYVDEGDVITLSPYERRTFRLPVPSAQMRAEGTLDDSGGGSGDSMGGMKAKMNVAQESAPFVELEENLKSILGKDDGLYVFSRQMGILTVYAAPQKVSLVEQYVKSLADDLSRSVKLHVSIIEVSDKDNKQHDYDWSWVLRRALITQPWRYGLTSEYFDWVFKSPNPDSELIGKSFEFGFKSIESSDTHKFLVRLLKERANVAIIESTNVMLTNGHPVVISKGQTREYISEVNRSVSDTEVSYDVSKGKIHSGLRLFLSGVVRKESLTLSMLMELQDLVNMETINFESIYTIQNPTIDEKRQGLVLQLADGETKAIVGSVGTRNSSSKAAPGFLPLDLLSNSASTEKKTDYIVILITPEIVKNEKGGFHEVL
jgi:type II secretory pathway component GspD/PulD (secretin)